MFGAIYFPGTLKKKKKKNLPELFLGPQPLQDFDIHMQLAPAIPCK